MIPVAVGLILLLLAIGLPVGAVLIILGLGLGQIFSPIELHRALGELSWVSSSNSLLVSVPLFILLGEILLRSGIADRLYSSMSHWLSWLPGGLMHANVGASMGFAATSGSSVATAATISVVAAPLVDRYKYNERLFFGSVAAGGTLGILIPPSINLIIYGWLTETSVPRLYLAGFLPGLLLAALFSGAIVLICLLRPQLGGIAVRARWRERIAGLPGLLPPFVIFLVVVGSIYAGVATPTESASLGVVIALGLATAHGRLTSRMMLEVLDGTMRATGMIMLIVIGAWFLNFVLSVLGFVSVLNGTISGMGLSPMGLLSALIVFYLVLGCFMDPLAMMIVTVPITGPMVVEAGFDPVWFGILIVLLCETALVTPPIGMNNVARWRADPRKVGMPSLRHPGFGIHICLSAGGRLDAAREGRRCAIGVCQRDKRWPREAPPATPTINQFAGSLSDVFVGDPTLFMLAVMGGLLVVGCFLEPGAAIVLFVPILFPVARAMGIDPLQFSMLIVLTLTMGLITPPVGVCLFVACRIGDISISALVKELVPFFVAELGVIVLIILLPGLSSWLPGLFR